MPPKKPSSKALSSIRPDDRLPPGPVADSDPDALEPLQDLLDQAVILHGINLSLRRESQDILIHGGHVVENTPPADLAADARPAFDALTDLIQTIADLAEHHGVVLELDLGSNEGVFQLTWGFPEGPAGPGVPEAPPPIETIPVPLASDSSDWRPTFVPETYPVDRLQRLFDRLRTLRTATEPFDEARLFVRTERWRKF